MSWLYASLIVLAPLYIWRFELVGLPTNFFMLYALAILVVGTVILYSRYGFREVWSTVGALPKVLQWAVIGFSVASVISLFVGGFDVPKFGQWLVLYVLPMKLAAHVYIFSKKDEGFKQKFIWAMYAFLFVSGALAILQYFFLIGLPSDFWGNPNEPKRAVGFFIHPNNFALFITPLLAFLLPDLKSRVENLAGKVFTINALPIIAWLLGGVALLLSLSRGGWLGFIAAAGIFVLVSSSKKLLGIFIGLGLILAIVVVSVPNLRYRILLPFYGEKSSVARLSLLDTGSKMVKDSPVLGQGIHGFNYNWDKFNTDPNLEHYNFPHNFVLNAWIDTGLLGLISWLGIVIFGLYFGFKNRAKPFALGLALFIIAILVHGLIDIPYFKNDLAMVFWLMFALAL